MKSAKTVQLKFSIFVLLKLTCLVTLFDRKIQVFKKSPKLKIFGIFYENVNVARYARNVEWDYFWDLCKKNPNFRMSDNILKPYGVLGKILEVVITFFLS